MELAGRALLEYSFDACRDAARVGAVVVAAPPGAEGEVGRLADDAGVDGEVRVTAGGATRAESVRNALEAVTTELVVIHDAARPLVRAELFDSVLETLEVSPDAAGVIAAAPVADTIKRAREARVAVPRDGKIASVAETLSREELWAGQTPQAFRTGLLREAQEAALKAGSLSGATDEAMLIERAGGEVLIQPAPAENLKVTTPDDLALAAALLESR